MGPLHKPKACCSKVEAGSIQKISQTAESGNQRRSRHKVKRTDRYAGMAGIAGMR